MQLYCSPFENKGWSVIGSLSLSFSGVRAEQGLVCQLLRLFDLQHQAHVEVSKAALAGHLKGVWLLVCGRGLMEEGCGWDVSVHHKMLIS